MQGEIQQHVSGYLFPLLASQSQVVEDDITSLISQLPGNRLVLDFNAHHQQWGSERSSVRGEQRVDIMLQTNLCLLNDGVRLV